MDIEQVHIPQRLADESMEQYRARQRMSKRLAERDTLVHAATNKPARVNRNQHRKALVKGVGIRQAKKAIREARAQQIKAGM